MDRKHLLGVGSCLVLGLTGLSYASSEAELKAKVAALEARLAELEAKQGESWLNERRAEEVKALVREVLSDAEMRKSLQGGGLSAGYDGKGFFLASDDGAFRLNVNGLVQVRYTANVNREDTNGDELGFEIPRAELRFSGHIADPKVGYLLIVGVDQWIGDVGADDEINDSSLFVREAVLSYELAEGLKLYGGQFTAPFLHESIVDDGKGLAVERSLVSELLGLGYVQGIGLAADLGDMAKVNVAMTDGAGSGNAWVPKGFDRDNTDFAIVARADVKLAGNWAQNDDFVAWSGDPMAAFIGGAVTYQTDEGDGNEMWGWTVDGMLKYEGWSLYAAGVGMYEKEAGETLDVYGVVLQGGYNITDQLQPFVRWEYIDVQDDDFDTHLLTVGVNWFNRKHNAKATVDVVWTLNDVPEDLIIDSNLDANIAWRTGLLPSNDKDQVVIRAQYQLMF